MNYSLIKINTDDKVYSPIWDQIRIYGTEDKPYFMAKDVAKVLNSDDLRIRKPVNKYIEHLHYEFVNVQVDANNTKESYLLTENGLYKALFRADTDLALRFQIFATTVLNKLRLTGEVKLAELEVNYDILKKENLSLTAARDKIAADFGGLQKHHEKKLWEFREGEAERKELSEKMGVVRRGNERRVAGLESPVLIPAVMTNFRERYMKKVYLKIMSGGKKYDPIDLIFDNTGDPSALLDMELNLGFTFNEATKNLIPNFHFYIHSGKDVSIGTFADYLAVFKLSGCKAQRLDTKTPTFYTNGWHIAHAAYAYEAAMLQ